MENLTLLIEALRKLPDETPWLEFKHNNYKPDMIGEDISALANGATANDNDHAYMIWGIDNATRDIVGTSYDLQSLKVGQQEIENWLRSLLSDNTEFSFHLVSVESKSVGVLIIHAADGYPVTFKKTAYIRVGSYTKKLQDYPALQALLWDKLRASHFEARAAMQDLSLEQALQLLDVAPYFELLHLPLPSGTEASLRPLFEDKLLKKQDNGLITITNLGAILFAKQLSQFDHLRRKAIRVVQYAGNSHLDILRQKTFDTGYVLCFSESLQFVETLLLMPEPIDKNGIRSQQAPYPGIVVREAIANMLIHQNFSISGAGPLVEIFESRIDITNPGTPLVDVYRIIDNPPRSRNELLSALMRRLGLCEELGSGWDRMVIACELAQLPAPKIERLDISTRVTLYLKRNYYDLSTEERLWSCYLHACIKYIQGEYLTNRSLRDRFGIQTSSSAVISRLIRDAMAKNLIKPFDPDTAPRYMKYMPSWA